MTRYWTEDEIREKLVAGNRMWIERAVKVIFEKNQTADEQSAENTRHNNGIGFNGVDGAIMSSFAKQLLKGRHLSAKQFVIAQKKIVKYSKQLVTLANKEV